MKLSIAISILLVLALSGCFKEKKEKITITANAWIGYSPLFYAREKGWLETEGIELISTASLGESMHIYDAGSANVFMGTQHEFIKQREQMSDLVPLVLFDRSNGGDAILSNVPLQALLASDEIIDVYLEIDSINEEMLKHFTQIYSIPEQRLRLFNKTQDQIVSMDRNSKNLTLLITYDPYNITLTKKGFIQIADTRKNPDLLVVDALYASSHLYERNEYTFKTLDSLIGRSIKALQNNPKEYYGTVKAYLDNPTYEEFMSMLGNIAWIHGPITSATKKQLQTIDFPHKDIIQ